MNHIKYIKEYNNGKLYHRISIDKWIELSDLNSININDDAINTIKNYIGDYTGRVKYRDVELIPYNGISKKKRINILRISTNREYITIYQLDDEYFTLSIDTNYYLCDEILGIVEFLKDEAWLRWGL